MPAIDAAGSRIATKTGSAVGYALFDLHGSIAAVSDAATDIDTALRYDAWGELTAIASGSIPTPWRYQGLLDVSPDADNPLYDMGARFYAPGLGAFSQFDTYAGSAQNPLSMNRFLYAHANPATLVDPTGHNVDGQAGCGLICPGSNNVVAPPPAVNPNPDHYDSDLRTASKARAGGAAPSPPAPVDAWALNGLWAVDTRALTDGEWAILLQAVYLHALANVDFHDECMDRWEILGAICEDAWIYGFVDQSYENTQSIMCLVTPAALECQAMLLGLGMAAQRVLLYQSQPWNAISDVWAAPGAIADSIGSFLTDLPAGGEAGGRALSNAGFFATDLVIGTKGFAAFRTAIRSLSRQELTSLFHVAGRREMDELLRTGTFGSSPSQGGKYFALTREGAETFAGTSFNAGREMTLVEIRVPKEIMDPSISYSFIDTGGAGASIHVEQALLDYLYSKMSLPIIHGPVG